MRIKNNNLIKALMNVKRFLKVIFNPILSKILQIFHKNKNLRLNQIKIYKSFLIKSQNWLKIPECK